MGHLLKYFYSLVLMMCFVFLDAQSEIDSLKKILRSTGADTVRIEVYNTLGTLYSQTDLLAAKKYADSALYQIELYEKQGKVLSPHYDKHKGMAYNTLANIYNQQGKFNEAIQYCFKTIKIFEKYKDSRNTSKLYSSLGIILGSIGNHKDALIYTRKGLALDEKAFERNSANKLVRQDLIFSYVNIVNTFLNLKNYDSCLHYSMKALKLADTTENSEELGLIYLNMGGIHGELNNYPHAIRYTEKALEIYKALGLSESISLAYSNLAELNSLTKNYSKALYYAELCEKINKENLFADNLLNIYDIKAGIYSKLNDTKNEIFYLKKHAALKDSLLKQNHAIQMEELKTQYETEKKEAEIVKLNNDNKIQELQLEKDAATKNRLVIIIIVTVLVLMVVGILAGFLYKTVQEKKKAFVQLQLQSEELNRQSMLISKYQSQMNPHFVFNALNSIQGSVLNDEKKETIDRLQLLAQLMRQTLNNSESEYISLETEINYLQTYFKFEKQKFTNNLRFNIDHPEEYADILIPPMMIQPFIENAIKHAGLNKIPDPVIDLTIKTDNDLLKIVIKDNGEGFNTKEGNVLKNSHALKIIHSRLQLLFITENKTNNIHFNIRSKPDLEKGTEVSFYLPLKFKY